ncbi:Serine/threonine-protein kinase PK-1 [Thalassocella blandensis]|nr:Serine/threonine-protein kinase PK-1 [Thalassocella blandensis]
MPEAILKDPLIGRLIKDAFRIDSLLAEGTMSRVYVAEQVRTKRKLALKVLRPWLNDVDFIELFLKSAKMYSEIDHPNVVGVVNAGRSDHTTYVAMELAEGCTLGEIVNHKGLSLANIVWLMQHVCTGVHLAHQHGVLHLDLKPSNIFVCKDSGNDLIAKVADFGIGRPLTPEGAEHTHRGMAMGLPGFISPEQILGEPQLDARADVYALGAILYFMLAGKKPYDGMNPEVVMQSQLTKAPERLRVVQLADPYAWKLQPIIFKAMSIKRDDRYANVEELWHAILKEISPQSLEQEAQKGDRKNTAASADAAKFMFIFKGELVKGAQKEKAQTALQTILNFDAKKTDKLFKQERSVIRKDISLESARRFSELFKLAGAIGYVEEMAPGDFDSGKTAEFTHRIPHALPCADMAKAVLLQDVPGLEFEKQLDTSEATLNTQSIESETPAAEKINVVDNTVNFDDVTQTSHSSIPSSNDDLVTAESENAVMETDDNENAIATTVAASDGCDDSADVVDSSLKNTVDSERVNENEKQPDAVEVKVESVGEKASETIEALNVDAQTAAINVSPLHSVQGETEAPLELSAADNKAEISAELTDKGSEAQTPSDSQDANLSFGDLASTGSFSPESLGLKPVTAEPVEERKAKIDGEVEGVALSESINTGESVVSPLPNVMETETIAEVVEEAVPETINPGIVTAEVPQVLPTNTLEEKAANTAEQGLQFGAAQQSWPQPSTIKSNAARQASTGEVKVKKAAFKQSGPIQFSHGPSLDLTALSFGSSSFQIAGMPQNSVGKEKLDSILDLSMSSSKLTITALGILLVITGAGYALFSPQMQDVVTELLFKLIG